MTAMGIAEPEALVLAHARIAAELGLPPNASETALRVALREADHLSDDLYDVPAALLFALGRTPRCFAAFRAMSVLVVMFHAKALGFRLELSPKALGALLTRIARRELAFEDVRSTIARNLVPFGG
jgi:hypothetical protein